MHSGNGIELKELGWVDVDEISTATKASSFTIVHAWISESCCLFAWSFMTKLKESKTWKEKRKKNIRKTRQSKSQCFIRTSSADLKSIRRTIDCLPTWTSSRRTLQSKAGKRKINKNKKTETNAFSLRKAEVKEN